MRALRMVDWNHDPELHDVPAPEPAPGEVVISIGGAGVCHSDLHLLYEFPPGLMPSSLIYPHRHLVLAKLPTTSDQRLACEWVLPGSRNRVSSTR